MGDAWEQRRKAQEDEYFERQNQSALERIQSREADKPRMSPITGEPMEQLTIMGVVVDRCPSSKGIWLDAGELDQILDSQKQARKDNQEENWLKSFVGILTGKE